MNPVEFGVAGVATECVDADEMWEKFTVWTTCHALLEAARKLLHGLHLAGSLGIVA
jgi:hypothetical protein